MNHLPNAGQNGPGSGHARSLMIDSATIDHLLARCQRHRYPSRVDVFRPGDPASTLYYVLDGSVSILAEEDDGRELVLGYFGKGEFVGEMGLFIQSAQREVTLRTRTQTELPTRANGVNGAAAPPHERESAGASLPPEVQS